MTTFTTACLTARRLVSRSLILKKKRIKRKQMKWLIMEAIHSVQSYFAGILVTRKRETFQHMQERNWQESNQWVAQESNSKGGMYGRLKKVSLFKIYIPPRNIMENT